MLNAVLRARIPAWDADDSQPACNDLINVHPN